MKKLLDIQQLSVLLKKNKSEALGWLITFLTVVLFDVDIGLYIGIAFSLILVIFNSQRARSSVLGNIPGTSIFECVDTCKEAKEFKEIRIIRYEESVYYVNVENFKYKIIKLSQINPTDILAKINKSYHSELKIREKNSNKRVHFFLQSLFKS